MVQRSFFIDREHHQTPFPGLFFQKKGRLKNLNFLSKTIDKSQFCQFLNSLFSQSRQAFFFLEYRKTHTENFQFSDQNHELTPFGKILIFEHFNSLTKRFCSLQYHQIHFPGLFSAKIKKWKILNFFYQNRGKTSLEKSQIFDFFKSLFLYSKQGFFFLEYHQTHFPGLFCLKLKCGKISIFPQGLTHDFASKLSKLHIFLSILFCLNTGKKAF